MDQQQSNLPQSVPSTILNSVLENQPELYVIHSVKGAFQSVRQKLLQQRLDTIQRRLTFELRSKLVYLEEWFQQNKDWMEDALTIFFSGVLAFNILSVIIHTLMASRKLLFPSPQCRRRQVKYLQK